MAAYWLIGLGYGLYATQLGLPWWFPTVTAMLIYSGSCEFILASLVLGETGLLTAFTLAVLVGARHLFYGITMLDRFKGAGWRKFFLIFMMSDETFALTFRCEPPEGVKPHDFMLAVSVLDWLYWMLGTTVGVLVADCLRTVNTEGVEFTMTAMFAAIFAENWRTEERHAGSLIGVAVAVACLVVFGPEKFMIPSMGGILLVLALFRRRLV